MDHGIEPPAVRAAAGKPEDGVISVRARSGGGRLEVEVADDGAGLDAERIRDKAIASGLLSSEDAASLSYEDVISFVTRPGFSTRDSAGEISGRGVGLDAVQEGLASIQGSLDISGVKGAGTVFTMNVPLAIAATELIVARLGGHPIGFPLVETDRILELDDPGDDRVEMGGAAVALVTPETLSRIAPGGASEPRYAVVVRSTGRKIAVPVEELIGVSRLGTMPLPDLLPPVDLIRSVAILANGSVLRLLDTHTLVEDLPPAPRLLVVDDSAAWLERGRNWFTEAGWEVLTAPDGRAAQGLLAEGMFDALLTDVEMPEVDGIELTRRVRAGEAGRADIPVVVWTASAGDEAGPAALSAGADAFLAKEAGNESEALEAIRSAGERKPAP